MTRRYSGEIPVYDERGYTYLSQDIRRELEVTGKTRIPYFKDANVIAMIRKGASKGEVLRGLRILIEDIDLRWEEEGEADPRKVARSRSIDPSD